MSDGPGYELIEAEAYYLSMIEDRARHLDTGGVDDAGVGPGGHLVMASQRSSSGVQSTDDQLIDLCAAVVRGLADRARSSGQRPHVGPRALSIVAPYANKAPAAGFVDTPMRDWEETGMREPLAGTTRASVAKPAVLAMTYAQAQRVAQLMRLGSVANSRWRWLRTVADTRGLGPITVYVAEPPTVHENGSGGAELRRYRDVLAACERLGCNIIRVGTGGRVAADDGS